MHVNVDAVQSFWSVSLSLVRSDVPEIPGRIFHATRALTVFLVSGLAEGSSARLQCAFINCIAIRNVNVKRMSIRRRTELAAWNAAAHHEHRITNAHLSVQPAGRTHGAKHLFGVKNLLGKLQQRG